MAEFPHNDATYSEVSPTSGRTSHEYLMTVDPATIGSNDYEIVYTLVYVGGWSQPNDNWLAKSIEYPTQDYHFILKFPSPWYSVNVKFQPPGATENVELLAQRNPEKVLSFEWHTLPGQTLKSGTRLTIFFEWPPLSGQAKAGV